jgi:hypothetical protein
VVHSGLTIPQATAKYPSLSPAKRPLQLSIVLPNGTELTDTSTRLNCSPLDDEVQIINLPDSTNKWILIYAKNIDTTSGLLPVFHPVPVSYFYQLTKVYYSIIQIKNNVLTFIAKDVDLNPSSYYFYGKALSKEYNVGGENRRYLYLKRNDGNPGGYKLPNGPCAIDQFTINNTGILMVGGSPRIQSVSSQAGTNWGLGNSGSPVELNEYHSNNIKLAANCRDDGEARRLFPFQIFIGSNIAYMQFSGHENFSLPDSNAVIYVKRLAILPSGNINDIIGNYTVNSNQYQSSSDFGNYIVHLANKITSLEFSPTGKYLYISQGGYVPGTSADPYVTYLGQIDLTNVVQTVTYGQQYMVRLQVEEVSGNSIYTNTNYEMTGSTGDPAQSWLGDASNSNYVKWHALSNLELAYNGKIYFTKLNSDTLYAVSHPDSLFTNLDYRPVNVAYLNSDNVILPTQAVATDVLFLPDGVDLNNYLDTLLCFPPPSLPCKNCIGSFAPEPGKKFLLSAWVKESGAAATKTSYTNPQIFIEFPSIGPSATLGPFTAAGAIIDGWQRIEQVFTIPLAATSINLKLSSQTGDCFFDDVRVLPFDGSMKSYVYDPVSMRLVAELDERNYATLYEYDEEGKLVRVKKETEKGIMTVKENKNYIKKR